MGVNLYTHYLVNRLSVFTSEEVGEIKGEEGTHFTSYTFELFLFFTGDMRGI